MNTNKIISVLTVVTWVIFIGLCIRAGAIPLAFIRSFVVEQPPASLYPSLELIELQAYSTLHYVIFTFLIIVLAIVKAYLFYQVIKVLSQLNISEPFSEAIGRLVFKIAQSSLLIGILALLTQAYAKALLKRPISFSYEGGETEFLFVAGILYVIAIIFRKGIELQAEQDLTV
jgi:hypothetical protein